MPTMLDSATGVSMIRSAPNSSMNPSETRKTPPRTPTSSPRRIWRSSRRNSPSSVSWTAWTFDFSVTGSLYLFERRELVGPALADEPVHRAEDVLAVRLREVVAVVADRDPVRLRRERPRRHVELVDAALDLEDLAEDVRRRTTGHVLVDHEEGAGLRDGSHDRPVHVEGEKRLHVDDLGADARVDKILRRLLGDAAERAVGPERDVGPLADDLGHAERHRELADVVRHPLLQPISREDLDEERGVVAAKERVVEARGLRHVPRHGDMETSERAEDQRHGRSGVPDPLQPMAFRPDEHRRLLPARGAEVERREIVGRDLERVEHVVNVLDVDDGSKAAERGADTLTQDRGLADAGVGDAQLAVLRLQALEDEVHVAELADVLADDDDPRIALEVLVEAADEQLPAVDGLRAIRVSGRDRLHEERRLLGAAREVRVEALLVLAPILGDVRRELRAGRAARSAQGGERAHGGALYQSPAQVGRAAQVLGDRAHVDAGLVGRGLHEPQRPIAVGADRRLVRLPRLLADPLDFGSRRALELGELGRLGPAGLETPRAHPADRVQLRLE